MPRLPEATLASGARPQVVPEAQRAEAELCGHLAAAMAAARGDKALELQLWDENWRTVYGIAEAVMARTMHEFMRD